MITNRELALIPPTALSGAAPGHDAAGPGSGRPPPGTDPGLEPEEPLPVDAAVDGTPVDVGLR